MSSRFEHRVSAEDDDLHEVRMDVPLWSESALIVCHDPATGISVYGHLVLLQNEVWESIFSVYLPNGEILTRQVLQPARPGAPPHRADGDQARRAALSAGHWDSTVWHAGYSCPNLALGPLAGGPVTRLEVDLICRRGPRPCGAGACATTRRR